MLGDGERDVQVWHPNTLRLVSGLCFLSGESIFYAYLMGFTQGLGLAASFIIKLFAAVETFCSFDSTKPLQFWAALTVALDIQDKHDFSRGDLFFYIV